MYKDWLAKSNPEESLLNHTMECVRTAIRLAEIFPFDDIHIKHDLILSAALHDLGKAASGFQKMLEDECLDWNGWRHESLSVVLGAWFPQASESVLMAILFHHKILPGDGICDTKGTLYREQLPPPLNKSYVWKKMAAELDDALSELPEFWNELRTRVPEAELSPWPEISDNWKDAPLLQEFDDRWVDRYDQHELSHEIRKDAARLRGLLRTVDHLASAHEWPPNPVNWTSFELNEIENLRGFQLTAMQTDGDMMMQAPTGSGKTEACLLWLKKNQKKYSHTYYVLPFTASINAMHRRLEKHFPGKVGVLHGKATYYLNRRLCEDDNYNDTNKKRTLQFKATGLKQLAKEMYYPIKVCTPHQLIKYFLRGPGWELMFSELQNACFVFDEIHACDPRMVGLIIGGMKLMQTMGSQAVFISATFPKFLKELFHKHLEISAFVKPEWDDPGDRKILEKVRHIVKVRDAGLLDVSDEIYRNLNEGTVLIVANHVASAQQVYRDIKNLASLSDDDAVLLHGSFNPRDRMIIEEKILSKNPPRLLVATQAIEVSLDISYDCGYFEAAPIDALIQRMGRVNRSGNAIKPAVINIMTQQISTHKLYNQQLIDATISSFSEIHDAISETQLAILADQVYAGGLNDNEMKAFYDAMQHPDYVEFNKRFLAGTHQDWVENVIEHSDQTIDVLPLELYDEYKTLMSEKLWLDASSLLVSIRVGRLATIRDKLFTSEDPWRVRLPYNSKTGLSYDSIDDIESQFS